MIGQTLSHYKITAKLGQGGMGEVYRAEDLRLDREVAIKVLPDAVLADPERQARFEREAKVLASLNHPNIAAIYEFGSAQGGGEVSSTIHFLAIELVEGSDLAERLTRGPLPVDETRGVALQIARGLEAAHASAVVHRDLKPSNVRITPAGEVKILDFGLAKAREPRSADESPDLSQSPTMTAQMTQAGVILGTVGYMSPEQARGEATDERTDIWSFGVVLYEMLTGCAPFDEPTASETLAAVLRAEISWDRLPEETPQFLRRVLRRCLVRDPRQRLHSIADARLELEAPDEDRAIASQPPSRRKVWGRVLLAGLVGSNLAATMLLLSGLGEEPSDRGQLRVVQLVDGVGVDYFSAQWGTNVSEPRISPDGSMIVYPSERRLWVRDLDRLEPRPIGGTDGAFDAFWSPDSESLAYVSGSELRRVDAAGGPSLLLARLEGAYLGGTWGARGRIVVGLGGRGLVEVPERGGEPRMLLPADSESGDFDFHSPVFLEDGESVGFVLHERSGYVRTIETFDGAERRAIHRVPAGSRLTSLAFDGSAQRFVVAKIRANAGLWAVPFEPGEPTSEAESQLLIANGLAPSVSSDGMLVYVDGLRVVPGRLMRVDRGGRLIGEVGQALWDQDRPVASPDGSRVATIATNSGAREIWVHDLERDTALRVTAELPENINVSWADGGESIVFATQSDGVSRLVKRRADGGGEPTVLIEGQIGRPSLPYDGRFVVYQVGGNRLRRGPGDLWWFPIGQPDETAPLVATPADEVEPAVSPDGSLLAYTSDESGKYEVYLRPLSGEGKRQRVSQQGGEAPMWSRDGRELYYVGDSTLIAVPLRSDGESLGLPQPLFSSSDLSGPLVQNGISALTLGPERDFLVVQRVIPGTPSVVAVENWTGLLEHRQASR